MSKNILVVDDEPDMAEFVADVVDGEGFDPLVSFSAKDALKAFKENQLCGIITDIVMPDMDGIEFLQEITSYNTTIPIILMSGYNLQYAEMAETIAEYQGLTVIGTLTKPFSPVQLVEKIDQIRESFF